MPAPEQRPCDLLISAAYVVPVVPRGQVLREHGVVVVDGRIVALLPEAEALRTYRPRLHVRRPSHLLLPGLVNAHGHSPMTLLRGVADDLPLASWLTEHIWPAEARWVGPDFVRLGTELALLEMASSGTTCFADMYFFADATAEVTRRAGLRAVLGLILLDFPTAWAKTPTEYIQKGRAIVEQLGRSDRVDFCWAPHSPYATSDAALTLLRRELERSDLRLQLHVDETEAEPGASLAAHGLSQVARLKKLGLLDERLLAAHFVHPLPEEVELLASAGAHVVHCPESNAKLASGMARVQDLRRAGINVALGTDGAASNNNLDMIEEMRTAALIGKLQTGDAAALPAGEVLEMATLGGARALGLEQEIGSLEVGKAADLACIDLKRERTWPVFDPVSQLVYAASGAQVTDTWVAGEAIYLEGRHQTLDREDVFGRAEELQLRVSGSSR